MNTVHRGAIVLAGAILVSSGCAPAGGGASGQLIASRHDSGFALSHDSYNSISSASDGKIYYVLSSESIDTGAQMYSFDPAAGRVTHIAGLTEASGEKGRKTIPQGKSHVNFVEANGKLYFATHTGYYSIIDGMEKMGVPPAGYQAYPGGHLLAFDMKLNKIENLGCRAKGRGHSGDEHGYGPRAHLRRNFAREVDPPIAQ